MGFLIFRLQLKLKKFYFKKLLLFNNLVFSISGCYYKYSYLFSKSKSRSGETYEKKFLYSKHLLKLYNLLSLLVKKPILKIESKNNTVNIFFNILKHHTIQHNLLPATIFPPLLIKKFFLK